jgi:transcriptional regulator with XRE-family HTH domain
MVTIEKIRKRIVRAIAKSGMTQIKLARLLGVSQSLISHYLHGNKMPALDTFANLCKILDVDANDILCINE